MRKWLWKIRARGPGLQGTGKRERRGRILSGRKSEEVVRRLREVDIKIEEEKERIGSARVRMNEIQIHCKAESNKCNVRYRLRDITAFHGSEAEM